MVGCLRTGNAATKEPFTGHTAPEKMALRAGLVRRLQIAAPCNRFAISLSFLRLRVSAFLKTFSSAALCVLCG
jgi:hypothetical protein